MNTANILSVQLGILSCGPCTIQYNLQYNLLNTRNTPRVFLVRNSWLFLFLFIQRHLRLLCKATDVGVA